MNPIDPATKVRRHEMRSAGHFWGTKAAGTVIAEGGRLTPRAIERRLQRIMIERVKALIELGADDDDIAAWGEACAKRFIERICRDFGRHVIYPGPDKCL